MRETTGYNKDKNGIEEFIKMKPNSGVKGKVTVQLINDDTKEVEQEVFTENVRMKWLDHQMYLGGIVNGTNAFKSFMNLNNISSSYSTPSSALQYMEGGHFKNILLINSDDGDELEKYPVVNGTLVGYCGFNEVYAGTSTKKGCWNKADSYIKEDGQGNLVLHNVYDFPINAANGTITHIGYSKQCLTLSYSSSAYHTQNYCGAIGLPCALDVNVGSSVATTRCSTNCVEIRKNVFKFIANISNYFYIVTANIFTGEIFEKIPLKGANGKSFSMTSYIAGMQLSKNGEEVYFIFHNSSSSVHPVTGIGGAVLFFVKFSGITGEFMEVINLSTVTGTTSTGSQVKYSYENTVAVVDIYETGHLYLFGGYSSENVLTEVSIENGEPTKIKSSQILSTDSDVINYEYIQRGRLYISDKRVISYKAEGTTVGHAQYFAWDKDLNLIDRNRYAITLLTSMDIVGKSPLAITIMDDGADNYCELGIVDKRGNLPMTTLTKLPSPVMKNTNFTMRVQYDVLLEVPNLLDAYDLTLNV